MLGGEETARGMPEQLCLACLEAVQTEDRSSVWAGHERHLALVATLGARGGVHFARRHALLLTLVAAISATLRSRKALLVVEVLLTCGERKHGAAVAAGDLLITGSRNLIVHRMEKKKDRNASDPSFLVVTV